MAPGKWDAGIGSGSFGAPVEDRLWHAPARAHLHRAGTCGSRCGRGIRLLLLLWAKSGSTPGGQASPQTVTGSKPGKSDTGKRIWKCRSVRRLLEKSTCSLRGGRTGRRSLWAHNCRWSLLLLESFCCASSHYCFTSILNQTRRFGWSRRTPVVPYSRTCQPRSESDP
jgi:hypothetical protein